MSHDLVTNCSSCCPWAKPLILAIKAMRVDSLTVHSVPRTAACAVSRQLLFKSSLPSQPIQIVSIGRVAETLILRRLESVRRPHRLPENRDLEHVRLPKHPSSLDGVFQPGREERLGAIRAVFHQDRIVTEGDSQDVRNRAENWQHLFAEEIDCSGNCDQLW
jgi:hypothetical protein